MVDYESDDDDSKASRFSLRAFLIRDWPYLAMLALALFGVAYTSIARQAMTRLDVLRHDDERIPIDVQSRVGALLRERPRAGDEQ